MRKGLRQDFRDFCFDNDAPRQNSAPRACGDSHGVPVPRLAALRKVRYGSEELCRSRAATDSTRGIKMAAAGPEPRVPRFFGDSSPSTAIYFIFPADCVASGAPRLLLLREEYGRSRFYGGGDTMGLFRNLGLLFSPLNDVLAILPVFLRVTVDSSRISLRQWTLC